MSSDWRKQIFQKILVGQIWGKGTKIGPETRSFVIFPSSVHYFSLKLHTMIACKNVCLADLKPKKNLSKEIFKKDIQGNKNIYILSNNFQLS